MKEFELTLVQRDMNSFQLKSSNRVEGDSLVEVLSQLMIVIAMMQNEWRKERKDEDDIPFDQPRIQLAPVTTRPVLVLQVEEAQAIADCPFANVNANDANYPGYNDAMGRIFDFANRHRKEQ